jgi:hypothetical protein
MTQFFRVECSKCGEIIETTARTFAWPFFCDECKASVKFHQDIAPNPANPANVQKSLNDLSDWAQGTPAPELGILPEHNPALGEATIENTTLLIADLEEQVSTGAKLLDEANILLEDMNQTINKLNAEKVDAVIENEILKYSIRDTELDLRRETYRANFNQDWRQELQTNLVRADREIAYWKGAHAQSHAYGMRKLREVIALKGRGFWARVFNSEV